VAAGKSCTNFQEGQKEDPGNYRLVSLRSVPAKIREKIILEVIEERLGDSAVISPSQHGFTRVRTCLTNFISFLTILISMGRHGPQIPGCQAQRAAATQAPAARGCRKVPEAAAAARAGAAASAGAAPGLWAQGQTPAPAGDKANPEPKTNPKGTASPTFLGPGSKSPKSGAVAA